jgi:membrane fusion protein (multidrug efflux system)
VAVNRQVDPTSGTLQIQALFPNPERLLRPGQYGRVRLRQENVGVGALVVPEKALSQLQGLYQLAVVGPDEKVQLRQVKVGPSSGTLRIVTDGVKEGERVVVDGLQAARDGAKVTAREPQTASLAPGGAGGAQARTAAP